MTSKTLRLLIVDADPSGGEDALRSQLDQVTGVELVGIVHSQRAALNQIVAIGAPGGIDSQDLNTKFEACIADRANELTD
jgi:hypothetical protein